MNDVNDVRVELQAIKAALRAGTAYDGMSGEALQQYLLQLNEKENLMLMASGVPQFASPMAPSLQEKPAGGYAAEPGPPLPVSRGTRVEHEVDERCTEAFRYLMTVPGKDVRGMLIDAFQMWFCVEEATVGEIKRIIGSLHCASLLIDDVEDGSTTRRGIPAAHMIYGTPTVINTANYMYFVAMWDLQKLDSPTAMAVFIQELLNLHRGQGQDIMWRDQCQCPSEEAYCQMVLDKTGGLFRLAVGILQSFSDAAVSKFATVDFHPFVNTLSLYFQIRDDFINCCDSGSYAISKGTFCEDLSEGKFSYPIIHCIDNAKTGDTRFINLLKQRPTELHVKQYAVSIMREAGSLRYTRTELQRLYKKASEQLESLGGNKALSGILNKLDSQLDGLLAEAEGIGNPASDTKSAERSAVKTDKL